MKKILIVIGMILALGVAVAGGFYGGIRYQSSQAEQVRNNFFNARGQTNDGQFPSDAPGLPANGQVPTGQFPGGMGGGLTGTVKTIDGNVMTLSTAQDVTTINLSEDTPIQQTVTGTLADLEPGMRVRILGQADDSGAITASQITILDNSQAGQPAFGQLPAASDPAATSAER